VNRLCLFCLFTLFALQIRASAPDSVRKIHASNGVKWLKLDDLHADTLSFHSLDTTANGFQNFNPIHTNEQDNARLYLGNLGLATQSLIFTEPLTWGFDLGRHSYSPYLKQISDLKFYRTLSPYTNLYYIWNRRKEQYFNLTFSQNIGPRFNYAVNFTRLVSQGDYNRQDADHLNYDVSMWYNSKNRRYQVLAGIINSSLVLQENGGIKNDSIFRVPSNLNSEFEPVFLNNASNRITDKQYFLKQSVAFGPMEELKLDTFSFMRIKPKYRLYHEIRFTNRSDEYRETPLDSGVYANIYIDSINTNDKIIAKQLQQRVGVEQYSVSKKSSRQNYASYYVRFDLVDYSNMQFDSTLNGIALASERNFQISKDIELKYKLINGIIGDFHDNRLVQVQFKYYGKNNLSFYTLEWTHRNNAPALMSEKYSSNHHKWENDFLNVINNTIKISYLNEKWKFKSSLSLGNINRQVYYDSLMMPRQLRNHKYYQLQIQKAFQLGKFHLLNQIYIQGTDQSQIIRMPKLFTYQSFYFQSNVFNKAMNIRAGVDVRYYTSTAAFNYDAASTQFYLSNTSLGDYPIVDFFLTASLKRAVLMLKIDHLNQGVSNNGYYMVNRHPLPDRALKVGLRWAFYD
jgi:hypothetical protein